MKAELSPEISSCSTPDIKTLAEQFRIGLSIADIAASHHVHPSTVYRWLNKYLTLEAGADGYEDLMTEVMLYRKADAEYALATAANSCEVARAREMVKVHCWDLERRRPKQFGQKSELTHDKTVTVIVHRETPQPVVVEQQAIEAVPVQSEEDQEVTRHIAHSTKVQDAE